LAFFNDYPFLCPPYSKSVRSFSQVLHFNHRFNYKDQGAFQKPHKRRAGIDKWITITTQTLNIYLSMMKLLQSALHQTLGEEITFQSDNNLKQKAKSTLELLSKNTVNAPEWTNYS
jgi:hypothetical protein